MQFITAYGPKIKVFIDEFDESRTKQQFKDECDINNVMRKYSRTGVLTHVRDSNFQYADVSELDYQNALNLVIESQEFFSQLPSKVRNRFSNDPAEMLAFLQDPTNKSEAIALGLIEEPPAPPAPPAPPTPPNPPKNP